MMTIVYEDANEKDCTSKGRLWVGLVLWVREKI